MRAGGFDFHLQQTRGADDDFLQIFNYIIIQPFADGKAREQRRGEQAAAGRRANQGEPGQVQSDAAGVRSLVNDDVEFEIFHRRIQIFFDGLLQAMDFVNEQHVDLFEIGEQAGEVARFFNGRAAGAPDVCAHGFGEDVGERGFAETGRAGK